jgi:hypothetical protein
MPRTVGKEIMEITEKIETPITIRVLSVSSVAGEVIYREIAG